MTRTVAARNQSSLAFEFEPAPTKNAERRIARASKPNSNRGETRLLRLSEVIRRTGLGKTKIYELQKAGMFPSSVHVTSAAVRWIDGEVEDWILAQLRTRSAEATNDPR